MKTTMKKLICVLLAIVMLLGLTACGKSKTETAEPEKADMTATETVDDVTDVTEEMEETDVQDSTESSEELPEFDQSAIIETTVILDQDNIKVTATALEYDDYSANLKLSLENNSDKTLTFSTNTLGFSGNSINGFMIPDGYFNSEIAPGKKANETATFSYDYLQLFGINEIADIVLGIRVTDEDYNETIYPDCQIKTSIADSYTYDNTSYQKAISSTAVQKALGLTSTYFTTDVLYDADNIQIVSGTLISNEDDEQMLLLEAVNSGTEMKNIIVTGLSVNGLTVYDGNWSSTTISSGKCGVISINLNDVFNEQYWEVYGLTDISSIDVKVGIQDGWDLKNENTVHLTIGEDAPLNLDGTELFSQDNIRIISKGILGHEDEYDSNLYLALLIENGTDEAFDASVQNDSLSVNDIMISEFGSGTNIPPHAYGVLIVELYGSDLEDSDITDVDQVQKVECVIEFGEGYDVTVEAPIVAEF
jgi:hypothetical protein